MTEATGRVSWCLLKHQSIITENISTKIILFLLPNTFLSDIADLLIFCFSELGAYFHVCPYVLRREQTLLLDFLLYLETV